MAKDKNVLLSFGGASRPFKHLLETRVSPSLYLRGRLS